MDDHWRRSTGRERCNRHGETIPEGDPIYVGPITGMVWCEAGAREALSEILEGECPDRRPTPGVKFDAMDALAALLAARRRGLAREPSKPLEYDS